MKVLVFGGTGFLGIHLVESLLARGHEVVLFNRGKSNPCFPQLQTIHGDRLVSHNELRGLTFDAALDSNGKNPNAVREAANILRGNVGHFSFVSSISAYDALQGHATSDSLITEHSKLAGLAAEQFNDQSAATYGGRKAECERAILDEFQGDALITRPGLIVGPGDSTDRFTYWPLRYNEGGDIVAPGSGDDNVQFIDARDFSSWMISLIEQSVTGTFNAVTPPNHITMKSMLAACAAATNSVSNTHWVDQNFLNENGIRQWTDMPAWAPSLLPISADKAVSSGLTYRPVVDTARDTLRWATAQQLKRPLQAGLSQEREQALLSQWFALNNHA